jgi:hypothetical protein
MFIIANHFTWILHPDNIDLLDCCASCACRHGRLGETYMYAASESRMPSHAIGTSTLKLLNDFRI